MGWVLLCLLILSILYILAGLLCFIIPANKQYQNVKRDVEIFVVSNGIHVDYVVPSISSYFNWKQVLDDSRYDTPFSENNYLGIGWGDRGFYLDIDTWAELTPKVAMRAMLIPSPTLMHITVHPELPSDTKRIESIHLSVKQYLQLCEYICSYFQERDGKVVFIPGAGYTSNDNFYEANGAYHAFSTCNFWVNRGLIRIGVRTPVWSHGGAGIFYQLKKSLQEPIPDPETRRI